MPNENLYEAVHASAAIVAEITPHIVKATKAILMDHFCGDGETIAPLDEYEASGLAERIVQQIRALEFVCLSGTHEGGHEDQ